MESIRRSRPDSGPDHTKKQPVPGAKEWDLAMAKARKQLDWDKQLELAIDPDLAREKRGARNPKDEGACSMCGDYCAVEIIRKYFDRAECPCND